MQLEEQSFLNLPTMSDRHAKGQGKRVGGGRGRGGSLGETVETCQHQRLLAHNFMVAFEYSHLFGSLNREHPNCRIYFPLNLMAG